ncbi:MAG: transglutaminase family protein [Caulobacteraceae bacterium]|nr:transglutaminase family protein [Caulobacter sp.]
MPRLRIRHLTRYRYRTRVGFGEHRFMLRPREGHDQRVRDFRLMISPAARVRYRHDVFGNCVGVAEFDARADVLSFESRVTLDHDPAPIPLDGCETISQADLGVPFAYDAEDMADLLRLTQPAHADPTGAVADFARGFLRPSGPTPVAAALADMTGAVRERLRYAQRFDGRTQAPAETLALGSGTCRDYAVLMMEAARALGLAARFVSGYLYSPPAASGMGAPKGGGHTHAWTQVYLPSCGWVEFDPTNGIVGNRDLIRVAVARDPRQAVPLSGTFFGAGEDSIGMTVSVDVRETRVEAALDGSAELTPVVSAAVDAPPRPALSIA